MRKKDHACSCTAAPVAHLHHVSILRPASIPQPIPHVEGHYARAEMNLENPSTSSEVRTERRYAGHGGDSRGRAMRGQQVLHQKGIASRAGAP